MKHNSSLFAALCLLSSPQALLAQDAATPAELVIIDLRPKEEREGFALAELDGKCNKDVFRIPDVATDPLKVDQLKADLVQMLPTSGDGKTLAVLNWSIYYNKQVQGGGGMLDGVGIQGYSVPTKDKKKKPGSKCPKNESAGGWYEGKEATTLYFPLVSEFEGTFGGKAVSARVVFSPPRKIAGKFEGDDGDKQAVLETVHKTAEAVAVAIGQ